MWTKGWMGKRKSWYQSPGPLAHSGLSERGRGLGHWKYYSCFLFLFLSMTVSSYTNMINKTYILHKFIFLKYLMIKLHSYWLCQDNYPLKATPRNPHPEDSSSSPSQIIVIIVLEPLFYHRYPISANIRPINTIIFEWTNQYWSTIVLNCSIRHDLKMNVYNVSWIQ